MNELFRSLRGQLFVLLENLFSKVVCCCFKDIIWMYKVTGKAANGKKQFDNADKNRVYVRTNSVNTWKEMNPKGGNKLPLIMEKYIGRCHRCQDTGSGDMGWMRGPLTKYSNPLHEVLSITESQFRLHSPLPRLLRLLLVLYLSPTHPQPFFPLHYYLTFLLLPLYIKT